MQALRRAPIRAPLAPSLISARAAGVYKTQARRDIRLKTPDDQIKWPYWMHEEKEELKPTFETPVWKDIFENNRVVLVWQLPSMSIQRYDEFRYAFFQEGIGLKRGAKNDLHPYLLKSKYRHMSRIMQPEFCISYGDELCIKKMMKLAKPFMCLELVGGCIDDQLLSRDQIIALGSIASIKQVQSELVGVLSTPAFLLSAYLEKHASPNAPPAAASPDAPPAPTSPDAPPAASPDA